MVFPAMLVGFLFKNMTFVNALHALEGYGYNHAYRRVLEGMIKLGINKPERLRIQTQLKKGIRAPRDAYDVVTSPEVSAFITKYSEFLLKQVNVNVNVPPFFIVIAKILVKRTPMGKIVDFINKSASKKK